MIKIVLYMFHGEVRVVSQETDPRPTSASCDMQSAPAGSGHGPPVQLWAEAGSIKYLFESNSQ